MGFGQCGKYARCSRETGNQEFGSSRIGKNRMDRLGDQLSRLGPKNVHIRSALVHAGPVHAGLPKAMSLGWAFGLELGSMRMFCVPDGFLARCRAGILQFCYPDLLTRERVCEADNLSSLSLW